MATLAMSKEFLNGFAKLEQRIRNKVHEHVSLFEALTPAELRTHGGLQLERHHASVDPRARTIRIDSNHRGIVFADESRETFVLTMVGTHDETDRWMAKNTFKVNAVTGALEVVDKLALEDRAQEQAAETTPEKTAKLYAHRRDKDFTQLGIEAEIVPMLRLFTNQDQLVGLLDLLPEGQATALIDLTGEDAVEAIYTRIVGASEPIEVDTDNLEEATKAKATMAAFHLVDGQDELNDILRQPLAQWRIFIHPDQKSLAYRDSYSGPARVTGGAGTGKTVVAMHRAKALAERLKKANDGSPGDAGKPILFTTYTRNLAQDIEQQLRSMGGADLLDQIEVLNIDRVAFRLVQAAEGERPKVAKGPKAQSIWKEVVDDLDLDFTAEFLMHEWEQVILAQNLKTRSDYFQASRAGRGIRLDRRPRAQVWKAYEAFIQRMRRQGLRTYLQMSEDAAGHALARSDRPYQHVVVDEAQDLHESQLRLLRALVAEGPNDLFLVGDSHQRIYDRKSSLAKAGIRVVGRSSRLRLNYRTTHQILGWSLALLGDEQFDDLDDGKDGHSLGEYFSCRSGPMPELSGHKALKGQLDALVNQVQNWIEGGIQPEEIGVSYRVGDSGAAAAAALEEAGIETCTLPRDDLPTARGVRLGTMHRMKGLEFPAVAVFDASDDKMPLPFSLTDRESDPAQHASDVLREACLFYVAATRARDRLWVGWAGQPSRFLQYEV